MIIKILSGIFKIIMKLVAVLLSPIDNLITQFLPGFSDVLGFVSNAFNLVGQFFGWILDATLINSEVIAFIITVITFRLTVPLLVSAIKLIVKWYNALKI